MIGFLHTAAGHVQTFTSLMRSMEPSIAIRHGVHPELLAAARDRGPDDPAVRMGVRGALDSLHAGGATVLVCTCSTIGSVAEQTDVGPGVAVIRLDRPMAEQAVLVGRRITVVAALAATLGPTRALLHDVAERTGRSIEVTDRLCEDAWAHFERGDSTRYLSAIASAVSAAAVSADVVVLAQASMASAAEQTETSGVPVLSSPRLGVQAAIRLLRQMPQAPPSSSV